MDILGLSYGRSEGGWGAIKMQCQPTGKTSIPLEDSPKLY